MAAVNRVRMTVSVKTGVVRALDELCEYFSCPRSRLVEAILDRYATEEGVEGLRDYMNECDEDIRAKRRDFKEA